MQFGKVPEALFDVPPPCPGYVNDQVRGVIYETHAPNVEPWTVLAGAASRAKALSGSSRTGRAWLVIGPNVCPREALVLFLQIRCARAHRSSSGLTHSASGRDQG